MSDNTVKVQITASYNELQTAFTKARDVVAGVCDGLRKELKYTSDECKRDTKAYESTVEQFGNIVQNRFKGINGAIEGLKTAWAQLAVVGGAAAFLGEAVSKTVEMTTEAQKLGRTLGVSATQASYLSVAIGNVHGTTDQFIGMAKGLDQQLKSHEDLMNRAGLATRDANGALKDQSTLVMDGLEVLRGYKEGTDRNIAATQIFGKGVQVSSEMLDLNAEKLAEAKSQADQLGLAIGADDVEASDKFRAAMNDMGDILDAVMKTIGSALLPILGDLAEWFSTYGPQALLTIRVAVDIVITVFKGLALAVKVVWEVVTLAFNNMVTLGQGFAQVFTAIFHGDFEGAKNAATTMMNGMQANIGEAFENIVNDAAATGSAVSDMWAETIAGPKAPKDSGIAGGGTDEADTSKIPKVRDTSAADARREAAEARRIRKEQFDDLMEKYRGEEQAAKDKLQVLLEIQKKELAAAIEMYGAKSKEAEKAQNRIAETERKIAEQQQRMDERAAATHRILMGDRIDEEQAAAEAREQAGEISAQKLIQLEVDYERRRYELALQGLNEEAILNADRIEDHQQTLLKIEELESAHHNRLAALATQAALEARGPILQMTGAIREGWAQTFASMATHQVTWREGLKQLYSQALGSFTQYLAKKLAASQIFANLEIALQKMVNAVLRMLGIQSATTSIAAKTSESTAKIGASAAAAGAGAAESQASIPYIGPILALAAMATVFAAVMAMSRGSGGGGVSIPSAAGGFDIPAGVNPLTQLHAREMVLPAKYADIIRGMDGGTGGQGGDTHLHINISAVDQRGIARLLLDNKHSVADALKSAIRDGKAVGLRP